MYTAGIITASDKGYNGERIDESGKIIIEILQRYGYKIEKYALIPDEQVKLEKEMIYMSDNLRVNLILTTGGTGFSNRDVTPEATKNIITKEANGIAEAIRYYSLQLTKRAMLSRGVSGIRGNTLIINLPGSPKAVREILEYILDTIYHGLQILNSDTSECARC
ncbi:molybdenum cofactor biosynthesis protein B [Clostridium polyendosporum]|uniref:Molybdenum cofactor biosynthesis protein B n=1 Tax=Clostridium polyendosporum TaxID=69208 RepID=A0A919VML3_9CLOT|nr:MogA/MoaB family molybdenum cofactor biosynthesis protein [Clostridium polyendosporum]GIM29703.1 molybdenum cofactor biosynthesis protein B [Clostridium polyendosporum]